MHLMLAYYVLVCVLVQNALVVWGVGCVGCVRVCVLVSHVCSCHARVCVSHVCHVCVSHVCVSHVCVCHTVCVCDKTLCRTCKCVARVCVRGFMNIFYFRHLQE